MFEKSIAPACIACTMWIMLAAPPALAAEASRSTFGRLADGRTVEAITLTNRNGVAARVITYGATLQSLIAPDAAGRAADLTLGYATLDEYVKQPEFFGVSVGRFANRIAGGRFTLDGKTYALETNNPPNMLHGGSQGFDKALWTVADVRTGDVASVTLRHVSPDGDQGFPGTLTVTALYSLDEQNALTIEYRATTDEPTIVNMTNHAYWNLAGEGSADGVFRQLLMIAADRYTPVDSTLIPTGELRSVAGTPLDFREPKPIGRDLRDSKEPQMRFGRGYDHNYVLGERTSAELRLAARAADPESGRVMEVLTNQPGIQLYSANHLNGSRVGKSGRVYRQSDGFALETQRFPDCVNQQAFESPRLDPGQEYVNRTVFRFSVRPPGAGTSGASR